MKKNRQPSHGSRLMSFLLSFFLTFIFYSAEAQTITGTVTGEENKPVNGANVTIKGTSNATVTSIAGKFSITAANNDIIVISPVGYATNELPVSGRNNISVNMVDTNCLQAGAFCK